MPAVLSTARGVRFSAGKCPLFGFELSTFELQVTTKIWLLTELALSDIMRQGYR